MTLPKRPGYETPCPRGLNGGAEQHRSFGLVHRTIDNVVVCMVLELAVQLDDAARNGDMVGLP